MSGLWCFTSIWAVSAYLDLVLFAAELDIFDPMFGSSSSANDPVVASAWAHEQLIALLEQVHAFRQSLLPNQQEVLRETFGDELDLATQLQVVQAWEQQNCDQLDLAEEILGRLKDGKRISSESAQAATNATRDLIKILAENIRAAVPGKPGAERPAA